MTEVPADEIALYRAQAIAKATSLLCHLDRDDIPAFGALLQVHGAFTDTGPLAEVVLGMGEVALMVIRAALGPEQASAMLREMTDELHGIGEPPVQDYR